MARSALRELINLGGLALQSEDCAIRAAVHHRGETGGLTRIQNEVHHQFIIWRAILPVWHADLEKHDKTDIALRCDDGMHYFELKNWRGVTGERQIPSIQDDVYKLQKWKNRYIVVTSVNPVEQTDENINILVSRIRGLDDRCREDFRFVTIDHTGVRVQFWIAGWPILDTPRPSLTQEVTPPLAKPA